MLGGEKLTIVLLALIVCFVKRKQSEQNNLLKWSFRKRKELKKMEFLDLLQYARDYKNYNDNNCYILRIVGGVFL